MARFRIGAAFAAGAFFLAACGGGSGAVPGDSSSGGAGRTSSGGGGSGGPAASPSSLTFSSLGPAAAQSFTVSVQYATQLSASSSDVSVATVSPATAQASPSPGNGGTKSATFTVTPVANGDATIVVEDKKNNTATVAVAVATPGPIAANPTSVTICPSSGANACNSNRQNVTIAQSNFRGTFSERDTCDPSVATVSGSPASGGSETFTITGGSQTGTCRATFEGAGASTGVAIVVAPSGINVDLHTH